MRASDRTRRRLRLLATATAGLAVAMGLVTPAAAETAAVAKPGELSENTARQIAALQRLKQTQSATESKIDSRLLVEQRGRRDHAATAALPSLHTGVEVNASGAVLVDIRADKVSDGLLNELRAVGAGIRAVSTTVGSVRAEVPLRALERLGGRGDVRRIEVAGGAMTSRQLATPADPAAKPESKADKAARIAEKTKRALSARSAPVISEGDRTHNADRARQQFGVTGAGVKICALSDGIDSLSASQAAGELPAVDVLPTQAGSGDEGTAMLEILHDLAPNAELGFATAFNSDASFADNIRALRHQLRCDVIVDDVLYFKESPFQDWIIAQAVNEVTADGALYFSSAGNEGNTVDGTSGHWEGDFVDSGLGIGKYAGTAHNFAGSAGVQIYQPISDRSSAGVPVTLFWSDPLGAARNDYDLYLLNAAGNVVSFSQDVQNGTQDPYERVNTPSFGGSGLRLAVVKFSGEGRYLSLSALRGRFRDSADGLKAYVTPGVTVGHSAAKDAFAVAAAPAAAAFGRDLEPGDPANPKGPYPGSFDGGQKLERFSSDGPRRMFYRADGTPITPGNVSATGGELRRKPDLTAADGVSTSVSGFEKFYGTSAAAPHAAAIAALVLSGNPGLPPAEVREALLATSVDIEASGVDQRAGAGIVMADRVLAYTGASPQPIAVATQPTVRPNDGGAFLDPGDTATVTVPVTNNGDGPAVSTSVVLSSPTPGVTIAPRSKFYGTVDRGQTSINNFALSVPADHPLGQPVQLDVKVTFAGTHSPATTRFPIPVGQPSNEVHTFAYTGAPVAVPDNDPTGAGVPIEVSGVGRASRVTLSIDGSTCTTQEGATTVGIDHSFVGDLVGRLTAPSGASAVLLRNNGSGGNNLCQVVFDDRASAPFSSVGAANAPFTGTWRGAQSLAPLLGAADGTWTFSMVDTASQDHGTLRAISLHVSGFVTPTA